MMTDREPIETRNLDIYGDATPWSRPRDILDAIDPSAMITWFLGTAGASGRPHAAGVGAMWVDGELYFTSGDATKKSKDFGEPFASIAVDLDGIDLVFEGSRTSDRSTDARGRGQEVRRWWLAGDGRWRRRDRTVQCPECRASAVEAVSAGIRARDRRRIGRTERRHDLAVRLRALAIADPTVRRVASADRAVQELAGIRELLGPPSPTTRTAGSPRPIGTTRWAASTSSPSRRAWSSGMRRSSSRPSTSATGRCGPRLRAGCRDSAGPAGKRRRHTRHGQGRRDHPRRL